jgi:hypothetical protein
LTGLDSFSTFVARYAVCDPSLVSSLKSVALAIGIEFDSCYEVVLWRDPPQIFHMVVRRIPVDVVGLGLGVGRWSHEGAQYQPSDMYFLPIKLNVRVTVFSRFRLVSIAGGGFEPAHV